VIEKTQDKMKYLKRYKIFENHEDIHANCKKYDITNYTINPDGSIDVNVDVNLNNRSLTKLPLNFRNVSGNFYCRFGKLTSLEGAPRSVGGNFSCRDNKLTSLVGSPRSVGGNFFCRDNQLTSLEGAPESVGGNFDCYNNKLVSLVGSPRSVGGDFDCHNNKLTSLEGAPESVSGNFYCRNNNLTSLEGAPESVGGYFYCRNNPVNTVIHKWINIKSRRWELMEYFHEMNVIQGNSVILPRLIAFSEDMNVEMPDIREIKNHYKIVE
jgi:hypothetical protein